MLRNATRKIVRKLKLVLQDKWDKFAERPF